MARTACCARRPTTFRAAEVGLDAFGYNFPNKALIQVLEAATTAEGNITRFTALAESDRYRRRRRFHYTGRRRDAFGRFCRRRRRPQLEAARDGRHRRSKLVLSAIGHGAEFRPPLPHQNISTEFHTEHGPFTQVPLPGNRSSLVWVQDPQEAAANAGVCRWRS